MNQDHNVETLYIKRGRRYQVWGNSTIERYASDPMEVGTCKLTYCAGNGHYRYVYGVAPETAGFLAAAIIAQLAMEKAIADQAVASPPTTEPKELTEEQLEILERFKKEMAATGALLPAYWNHNSAYDIAQAGIKAVEEAHRQLKSNSNNG